MEVKPGYSTASTERIPHDWDVKRIGSVIRFQVGYPFSSVYFNGKAIGIRLVKNRDLKSDDQVVHYAGSYDRAFLVTDGDVLVGMDGDFLPCIWAKGPALLNQRVGRIVPKPGMDRDFAYYCLLDPLKAIEAATAGTTVKHLSHGDIEDIEMPLPQATEQRAIAAALSDVDALLAGLDRIVAKKRDLKQAAMQQLLTGQTRLPGFQGEWVSAKVHEVIADSFCGPSPTCEERNIESEMEWGVLKTTAATKENGWDWTKHKTLPRVFWNKPQIELRHGDVIVTKAGPRHRVGVTACVDYVPPRIIPSGKMIALRPRLEKVEPLMLAAAISARDAQTYLDHRTTGMAESQVNFENVALLQAPIRIPCIEEQSAIVAVLSDMDAELTALEARRKKTRALKQGMMQELLTGRTRLV